MSEKSQRINHEPAFLLAAAPWRESSLRLEMYSRRYGRVSLLARSARKRQSELRGVLVPFVPVSVSWYGGAETKTLHRAEWLGGWPQPQGRALLSGLYLNELVLKLTPREDAQPGVYDALAQALKSVCTETAHAAALRRFEWRLRTGTRYLIAAEQPPQPYTGGSVPQDALTADGGILRQLHEGRFEGGESLHEALKITRLLLDFRLPEGIRARRVLQQMQQFAPPPAPTDTESAAAE